MASSHLWIIRNVQCNGVDRLEEVLDPSLCLEEAENNLGFRAVPNAYRPEVDWSGQNSFCLLSKPKAKEQKKLVVWRR